VNGAWIAAFLVERVATQTESSPPAALSPSPAPRTESITVTIAPTGTQVISTTDGAPAVSQSVTSNETENETSTGDDAASDGATEHIPARSLPEAQLPAAGREANLRAGPGTNYRILGTVASGERLRIVAANATGDWYFLAGGQWIAAFLVENGPVELPDATDPSTLARPPVGSGWSEAEFAYVNELEAMLDDFFDALEHFGTQSSLLNEDEDLLFDRNWRTVFFASANRITETVTDLRILGSPPRFAISHAHILSASYHFEASMTAITQGMRTLSNALIDEAVWEMDAGVDALELGYRFMSRLEGIEVQ
jgi:hypothetical protein